MTWLRLVRAELRKLTTTKMPWAFLAVLVVISATTATAVVLGTDMDGSKGFIATAEDQRSLVAFGANAMMIAGLFGAIAVAREYGHGTVVPTFLIAPRRHRAVLAQLTAVLLAGGLLGLVGEALTVAALAVSLPMTEYGFLVSAGAVTQLIAAAMFAGAAGGVLGAGVGALVRNTGGAVTGAVLLLFIIPPILVQLANETASWLPSTLVNVVSGVGDEVGVPAALAVLAAWGLIPAVMGLVAVEIRDVV
jgi:ABC-type transport system involved in multi-copper enzyme maturation permease subunit